MGDQPTIFEAPTLYVDSSCATVCTIELESPYSWITLQGSEFTIDVNDVDSTTGVSANAIYTDIRVYTNSPGACNDELYLTVTLLNPCDDTNIVSWGPIEDVTIYLQN